MFWNVRVFAGAWILLRGCDDRQKRTQNVHFPHAPLFVETRKFHRKRTAAVAAAATEAATETQAAAEAAAAPMATTATTSTIQGAA